VLIAENEEVEEEVLAGCNSERRGRAAGRVLTRLSTFRVIMVHVILSSRSRVAIVI
jgi:hypothetical protein